MYPLFPFFFLTILTCLFVIATRKHLTIKAYCGVYVWYIFISLWGGFNMRIEYQLIQLQKPLITESFIANLNETESEVENANVTRTP